jgi:hypothetical protein
VLHLEAYFGLRPDSIDDVPVTDYMGPTEVDDSEVRDVIKMFLRVVSTGLHHNGETVNDWHTMNLLSVLPHVMIWSEYSLM